jgi:glycosyltransferase involved in cell wall biosynthesis
MDIRVLWITNTLSKHIASAHGQRTYFSGGWTDALLDLVSSAQGYKFAVATCADVAEIKTSVVNGINFYTLPRSAAVRRKGRLAGAWVDVCEEFKPDIIHIYGTEYSAGIECFHSWPRAKYIISVQGLPGIISRYYNAGIGLWDVLKNVTLRDLVRADFIFIERIKWASKIDLEREYFNVVRNVDGRTRWDYAHTKNYNKFLKYHHCGRVLRAEFYQAEKWSTRSRRANSVFLTQAGDPFKGLHKLLIAVALLLPEYPDIKISVGGRDITNARTIRSRFRMSTYGRYVRGIIKKLGLSNAVEFVGEMNVHEMISQYQRAHVFVCPSSIENSPNSVAEAQFIGTPVVASFVGGTPDYVDDRKTGLLYNFDEVEVLADCLRTVFSDDALSEELSRNGILAAERRHDQRKVSARLLEIYRTLS